MTNKLDGLSLDLEQTNKDKLKTVFPECFSDGTLDIDKLLSLCGEYIDNDFEKYKFEWKGKAESLRLAQKRSSGTLRPCKEESVNFDTTENLYIEGDNLEVLKLLQTAYYRKVKMIYIDPPYNTGNDFVYEDNFKDPMARYKEITSQTTKSNPETMGRYHTNWLNMMYPRLRLASNLLRDDGVIFISIDDNEVHNLRKICDEVFGEENFVSELIIKSNPGGRDYGGVAITHEYLLCYGKSQCELNLVIDKEKQFQFQDNIGEFDVRELRNRNIKFNMGNRPNLCYPFYVNTKSIDSNGLYEISLDAIEGYEKVMPLISQGVQTVWRWGKAKSLENINVNVKAKLKNDGTYMIVEKYRSPFKRERSIWDEKTVRNEAGSLIIKELFGNKPFEYPKSIETIKRIVNLGSVNDTNDIILDFFSGSATTAHAVMQLNAEDSGNRKFICVQLPELTDENSEAYKTGGFKNICEIGKERIRRAGTKLIETTNQISFEEQKQLDTGFKVFKLDTSNMREWDSTPIENDDLSMFTQRLNEMVDSIKPDRTAMDVIYEVMLKMGVTLDTTVSYIDVNGKVVYVVGDMLLIICFAENITAEDIEAMADHAPAKIICAEQSFADDTALSNAHYILKDRQIEMKLV